MRARAAATYRLMCAKFIILFVPGDSTAKGAVPSRRARARPGRRPAPSRRYPPAAHELIGGKCPAGGAGRPAGPPARRPGCGANGGWHVPWRETSRTRACTAPCGRWSRAGRGSSAATWPTPCWSGARRWRCWTAWPPAAGKTWRPAPSFSKPICGTGTRCCRPWAASGPPTFPPAAQASVKVSVDDPLLDAHVNVIGGLHLLEAAREAGVKRFVFASTGGALYGEVPDGRAANEGRPLQPKSPYGAGKAAFELYLDVYRQNFGLSYTVLRYANVYGPRQILSARRAWWPSSGPGCCGASP